MTQEGSNPDSSSARRFESIKEKASGKSLDLSKAFISSVFNIFSWGGLYQNAVLHINIELDIRVSSVQRIFFEDFFLETDLSREYYPEIIHISFSSL